MTETNERLFKKLESLLPHDYQPAHPNLKHWLKTSEDEKNWLKNAKFKIDESLRFGESQQIAIVFLDGNTYLICIGLKPSLENIDFEPAQVNSGIFCAAIIELDIKPITRELIGLELFNDVFTPPEKENATGIEHEFTDISKYFPELSIYLVNPRSPLLTQPLNLPKIGLFVVTNCPSLQNLNWSQNGLEIVRVISTIEVDIFPYELILRAIVERKWDNAFLEIYRCIEFLLPFPKINELKIKLNLDSQCAEISEAIEDILGWRPTEEGALQGLFKNLPKKLLNDFKISFSLKENNAPFDNKKAASLVYKLRNDCVHFRPIQRASKLRSTVEWETLLHTMLRATHFCYTDQFISKA